MEDNSSLFPPKEVVIAKDTPAVIEDSNMLTCPICNHQLKLDNTRFNRHVDECLNKVEVKEILKSERPNTESVPLQKRMKK